ncbi:MAG: hypothetical protein QOA14_08925 [Nitrososphaeraceae archaeon]|nr:hypothetical protein [Nitrososphaeraceae archaeon]MDW0171315.1 hypothetical protein [Nitrososphaeraceae archaeon]MDW0176035.1 hypothetical protein [Nitrososphaeraceae archaeon]MDW0179052.1 hypothetical protein [Nitrososphaeraceae archaeon]MDW0185310.1 hypothetical protein [Nitrososphaeraceae archaeon]
MNEMKLKDLFVSSLESSHILNSKGGSVSFASHEDENNFKKEESLQRAKQRTYQGI